ncbi:MAG: hypothetical protein HON90_15380 [Halobacteriovoraceae bacterium]|jgi:two-component system, OmpR family, phosphate regulon sensor histidine kinase PhoR|nr:hypothetical protein [Halobacteriovoraceae bacterium]
MKFNRLFLRLFLPYFSISLVGIIILLFITRFAFRNFYYNEVTHGLVEKAYLVQDLIAKKMSTNQAETLQQQVKLFAMKSKSRMTIILPDGKVIADSSSSPEEMESHANREEIIDALKGDVGEVVRFSSTLKEDHLYIAVPLVFEGEIIGVLRNSVSTKKLHTSLSILITRVIAWSFLLLLVLTYFIYQQSRKISYPLEELKNRVESFAQGDFTEKIETDMLGVDEVSALSISIGTMSEKIQNQISKISKQKNEQLAVFASMLEGVITIFPDMTINNINKSALKLFKYTSKKPIKGTDLLEIIQSKEIESLAVHLLENHQPIKQEISLTSDLIIEVQGTILEKQGDMIGAVLVFNDVTKVKRLERHRKQFVANVSHELKTPLTSIQGYLETIIDDDIRDEKMLAKFLGIISKHTGRLKTIIDDLLTLSSLEQDLGTNNLQLQEVKISTLLDNVVLLCGEKAHKKNIFLKANSIDLKIKVNIALIEQAIINLVDNAIKHGPENSHVFIEAKKEQSYCVISVLDEGIGIEEKHHQRIFERFYSVDKARSRELGGSGLGLSIVKHIVLQHQGRVGVESKSGHGARFIISLPV